MLAGGRVPHGLLFAGPEGVGKRGFAFELARALMCRTPVDGEGCGTCPICSRIGMPELPTAEKKEEYERVFLSGHPDVGVVVPYKRNILVGSIRELEREANFRPFEAERRFFMIDDADKMNDPASNALLKTLEEPPVTTYIVLVTSRPDSLLQTIRSRCQTIRFAPAAVNEIEELLVKTQKYLPEDAALAARVCEGSVGRAIDLDISQFRSTRDMMLGVLRAAAISGDLTLMLQTGEQLNDARNKDRFEENVGILQALIRDVLAIKLEADRTQIVNADTLAQLTELAEVLRTETLSKWLLEIEELFAGLNVNINRKIAADKLFVSMTA